MSDEGRTVGYGVFAAKGPFKSHTVQMRPLGSTDVELRVTHCGVCYSDIHTVDGSVCNIDSTRQRM